MLTGTLAGRYRIERQIGHGGMATVYLATDLVTNTTVAVKAPHAELVAQLGPERFAREVRISTQLQHPGIVAVLDSGVAEGMPFYVMPFVDGETLEQRLARTGPLPVLVAIQIACEIAEGLAYAHRHGFVHRDVKPANILLSNGRALLADFGIARAIERGAGTRLTETGFAVGTADYMSPEQASSDTLLDGRSDVYSLACVLYEMLVGAPPFTGPTTRSVMARHFMDPVPSLRTVRETVPMKLEQAVMRAMAKSPVDRYESADDFRDALRDPRLNEAPDTPVAIIVAAPPVRRRFALFGAAAAVIGVMLAVGVWRSDRHQDASLDANRVMVYPFVLSGGFTGAGTTGEDVATVIGNALDNSDPLRWIDGWALLDKASRSDIRALSNETARQLARSRKCATFLTGRLVSAGDSVRVFLTLYDVRGDSVLASTEATGLASNPWTQGLSAVNGLLPRLIPGSTLDLASEWKNRTPGAVAQFLLGESAFRRVRPQVALKHYRKAIEIDSTFAIAALRGAQAASWQHKGDEAEAMLRVALAQPLTPRYQHFTQGFAAYLRGRGDSAVAHLRMAITLDPGMTVAWIQLGEVYAHLQPLSGDPDSLSDEAFDTARRLDSTSVATLLHPIEIRLRRGDLAGAEPLLVRFRAAEPDSEPLAILRISEACVRDGVASLRWPELVRANPEVVIKVGRDFAGARGLQACGIAAFSAILAADTSISDAADGRRFVAMLGLQAQQIARGDPARAATIIGDFVRTWSVGESLFLLQAPLLDTWMPRAREIAARDAENYGAHYASLPYARRLWALGVLELRQGNVDAVRAIATTLRARGAAVAAQRERVLATSLDAQLLLARGDSAGAERQLMEVLSAEAAVSIMPWDEIEPRGAERLLLATLLQARGENERAIGVATVFDAPRLGHLAFLRPSLALRARAAKSLGNLKSESHYLARIAALRSEQQATGG